MAGGGTPGGEYTVLVVDDEPAYVEAYAAWLEGDYEVRTATSGEAALAAFDGGVDVVLLDRRMPDSSGREVLAELRSENPDCRVAMVTAVTPREDIVEIPFDDYLLKPVGREELRETVAALARLGDVSADLRACYSLAVKKAALEASLGEDVDGTTEYAALAERLAERQQSVERAIDDLFEYGAPSRVYESLSAPGQSVPVRSSGDSKD